MSPPPDRARPLPRAVFFDVGDTLLDTSDMMDWALHTALVPVDPARTIDEVRAAVRRSGEELPLRQPPFHEVRANVTWWIDRYRRVGEALALTEDALARWLALVTEAHFAGDPLRVIPDAPRALARLEERGILLGVISNWDDTLERVLEKKGLRRYFRVLVASTVLGIPKPERGIFEHALLRLGVAAHEAWHVGDDARADALGAVRAGLSAVLLDPHWMYDQVEAAGVLRARTLTEAVDHILGAGAAR